MAIYYVDPVNGNDANNGLGPDASHASNKPWKTLGKLFGTSALASGDTAYLAPGTYRETVAVNLSAAVTTETKVLGDPQNAQGFKTSGGARVAPGPVVWTAFTSGDTSTPSSSAELLHLQNRDFLTFKYIEFIQGAGKSLLLTGSATDITFSNCSFQGVGNSTATPILNIQTTDGAATPSNWKISKCAFFGRPIGIYLVCNQASLGSGSNDIGFVIEDCLFVGTNIQCPGSASTGAQPGGVIVRNCTFINSGVQINGAAWSTTLPMQVSNCLIITLTGLNANISGQISESYNVIHASTPRTNVTAGTGSVSDGSYPLRISYGQEFVWQGAARQFGEPLAGSVLLGFGSDGSAAATDLRGFPRPAGGSSNLPAPGALERSNTFGKETSTVRNGTTAISITGPGYHDFDVPVNTDATTVSVWVQWDATYTGTKPKMSVFNGNECGVADATTTATGSSGAWEQLSLTFTATSNGIVTIRLHSSDTNGGGKMFADDWAVT